MSAEDPKQSFQTFILKNRATKPNIHIAWKLYARYVAQTVFLAKNEGLPQGLTNLLGDLQYGDMVDPTTVRPFMQRFQQDTFQWSRPEVGTLICDIPLVQVPLALAFCRLMVNAVEEKYKPIPE